MPNWCENKLRVTGTSAARAALRSRLAVEGTPITFVAHAPRPETFPDLEVYSAHPDPMIRSVAEMMRKSPGAANDGWYVWSLANWGTKWDADIIAVEDSAPESDDGVLEYSFFTAWSPPVPWFHTLTAEHPELDLRLASLEPSCDIAFISNGQSGVVTHEISDGVNEMRRQLEVAGYDLDWLDETEDSE